MGNCYGTWRILIKLLPKKIRNKEERNDQILRSSFHSLEPGGCHDSTLVNDSSFVLTENKTEVLWTWRMPGMLIARLWEENSSGIWKCNTGSVWTSGAGTETTGEEFGAESVKYLENKMNHKARQLLLTEKATGSRRTGMVGMPMSSFKRP